MIEFADYLISAIVASGPERELFQATRRVDGRPVLIQVPAPTCPEPEAMRAGFDRELALASQLDPAWAVVPLGLAQSLDGRPALILDGCEGAPLDLLPIPLNTENLLLTAWELAGLLVALHGAGLVHGDLAPQHILSTPAGLRLTGFAGAFRAKEQRPGPPQPGEGSLSEATLPYMSPERMGRAASGPDQRSDLYSLGMILYRLAAGRLPWSGSDLPGWMHGHMAIEARPLCEVVPSLPEPIGALVQKLIAKDPEQRYPDSRRLRSDLDQCLWQWRLTGRIEPFAPAGGEAATEFLTSHRLFGREPELEALREAFRKVSAQGRTVCLLVSGFAGIGKTSLIREFRIGLGDRPALFLEGKLDLNRRDMPYGMLVQTIGSFVRQILASSPDEQRFWRERIRAAVGINGRLVTEFIPGLEELLGVQPPMPALPLSEAQNRFSLLLQRFIAVFSRPELPLILFLDDLQWADPSSLGLIRMLLTSREHQHLLLLGAYRDNEVPSGHPLTDLLAELRREGVAPAEIRLAPLPLESLVSFTADILHAETAAVAPLCESIFRKTGGNPFYYDQFLKTLYRESVLRYDWRRKSWTWEADALDRLPCPDDVLEFMTQRLLALPAETRRRLAVFACLAGRVEQRILALLCGRSPDELARDLAPALAEGYILAEAPEYRFLHDRIQQAALALTPEEERSAVHLGIARLLAADEDSLARHLFDAVEQYRLAAPRITEPAERIRAAELALAAARMAKGSSASSAAVEYAAGGLSLLGLDPWAADGSLAFALSLEEAESRWLSGHLDLAEARFGQMLARPEPAPLDRARILCDLIEVGTAQGRMREVIGYCRGCLELLGLDLPADPPPELVTEEFQRLWESLGARSIESLLELPAMQDPRLLLAMRAMAASVPAAIFTSDRFLSVMLCRMADLSIRHGNSDGAASSYVYLAMMLGPVFGRYDDAYRFGRLACDLATTGGYAAYKARILVIFGNVVNIWCRHMKTCVPYVREAFSAARELGDLSGACYCCNHLVTTLLALGAPLTEVNDECEKGLAFVRRAHYDDIADILISHQRLVLNLLGRTDAFSTLDGPGFSEAEFEAQIERSQMTLLRFWHGVIRIQADCLRGEFSRAVAVGHEIADLLWSSPAHTQIPEYHFYFGLALAATCDQIGAADRERQLALLREKTASFATWAEACPDNFRHKHKLLAAELARLEGDAPAAADAFESAIRSAREAGFIHIAGLAYERAACFYRGREQTVFADAYVREAMGCFAAWGATAKVQQVAGRHPHVALPDTVLPRLTAGQPELLSVIKSSQAISGETELPALLGRLLSVALESAGAQHCVLLLLSGDHIIRIAQARVSEERIQVDLELPVAQAERLVPAPVLRQVMRSRQALIVADASRPGPYADAFQGRPDRSVLCLPILRQGRVLGILYLDNTLLPGVFTAERLDLLELLAAQSAISIENARLYAELRQEIGERKAAEESLRIEHIHLRDIIIGSPVIICTISSGGMLTSLNPAGEEALGPGIATLIGCPWWETVFPGPLRAQVPLLLERLHAAGAVRDHEMTLRTRSGEERIISWHMFRRLNEEKALVEIIGFGVDVTARRRAELLLRESQQRLELATSSGRLGIWDWDIGSDRLTWDAQMFRLYGLALTPEASGIDLWRRALHPDDQEAAWAALQLSLGGAQPFDCEFRVCHPDGSLHHLKAHGVVLRDDLGRPSRMLGINYDITERKLLEERLLQAEKLAGLGRLAGGIAHNFNNQLVGVLGYADLLQSMLVDEQPRRYAANIVKAAGRCADLTTQLLAFARKGKFLSVPVDMHQLIGETVALLQQSLDRRIEIKQRLQAGRATTIGDPTQLQNMLLNLALNARDAMRSGGTLLFATEETDLTGTQADPLGLAAGRYLQLSVTDTGVGMAPETRRRLFEPFFTTKEVGKGVGLGLASVHGTVIGHRGAIAVRSELGQGTTFTVYLPLPAGESQRTPASAPAPAGRPRTGACVLLVDDEPIALSVGLDMLQRLGHEVLTAADGAAALARYRTEGERIDLVILDVIMPVLGGRETFAGLRAINPAVRVLVSSGFSIDDEASGLMRDGALGFLQKPFNLADLAQRVEEALRQFPND